MTCIIDKIALGLIIAGGLNWLSVGLFSLDIVSFLFGDMSYLTRIVFILIGCAGIWAVRLFFKSPCEK